MASLGKRLLGRRYGKIIPRRLDKSMRYLRYAVLAAVVIATAVSAKLVFSDYDPYFALFNFWTGEVALTAFIILGLIMLLSLIVERPFCRYACPYGALLGLSNRFRIFKIRRVASTCIDCKACDRACPMGINISEAAAVTDAQCISCLRCTSEQACPVADTVIVASAKSRKGLTGKTVGLLSLIIFFGAIGTSFSLGWWQTVSQKVPRLIAEGELAGEYDPSDIRGSYTFGDIERHFAVPADFLARSYLISADDPTLIAAKDLELTYGEMLEDNELELGTDSLRYLVSLYLGFPYTPEDTTGLPIPGLEMLLEQDRIDVSLYEQLVRERGVQLDEIQPVAAEPETTAVLEIKGITTFNDLLSNGVRREDLEEVLGFPIASTTQTIKEAAEEAGIEFSVLKQRILEHLAAP
jgi:ferredoxin